MLVFICVGIGVGIGIGIGGELILQHYLSPNLACNSMSILKVEGKKFMYLVKIMVLMYITHFKLFG